MMHKRLRLFYAEKISIFMLKQTHFLSNYKSIFLHNLQGKYESVIVQVYKVLYKPMSTIWSFSPSNALLTFSSNYSISHGQKKWLEL